MSDYPIQAFCHVCAQPPTGDCMLRDEIQPTLCPRRMDDPRPPSFTITAKDPQAPALLRSLAAKIRTTDQKRADEIDREAVRFEAWRRTNLSR